MTVDATVVPPEPQGGIRLRPQVKQLNVPTFFICPVSLELMKDPVTLCTGMSYDRSSIEKWLTDGHRTCPITNQVLENNELIPNHTLRRLIQDWCVTHKAFGVERISTPKQPVKPDKVKRLLEDITQPHMLHGSLKQMRSLAQENDRNRRIIAEAKAVSILAGVITTLGVDRNQESESKGDLEACEEALGTIALLPLSIVDKKALTASKTLSCLCWLLTEGSLGTKVNASKLLCELCESDRYLKIAVGSAPNTVASLVHLLKEDLPSGAPQAALKCLLTLCIPKKNRVLAIESNAIKILVDLLPNAESRNTEGTFALLEILASCAEGREAISNHPMAIFVIVQSLLGVSDMATEHAVAALWSILSYASNRDVVNSALQAGAFTKLLMLLPSNCSQRSKHKARDILKLLNQVWGSYTCRPQEGSESNKKKGLVFKIRSRTGLF